MAITLFLAGLQQANVNKIEENQVISILIIFNLFFKGAMNCLMMSTLES